MLELPQEIPAQVKPITIVSPPVESHILYGDSWAPTLCSLLDNAKTSIYFCAYSISTRWPSLATDAFNPYTRLLAAPDRGIDCRLIIAEHKKTAASAHFNRTSSEQLKSSGWKLRFQPAARLLHSKMMIIDSKIVIVGSHNFAYASSVSNIDISVCHLGEDFCTPFVKLFRELFANGRSSVHQL